MLKALKIIRQCEKYTISWMKKICSITRKLHCELSLCIKLYEDDFSKFTKYKKTALNKSMFTK